MTNWTLLGALFARTHMSSPRGVTLLDPDLFWGVKLGTRHWAKDTNGFRCTFKPRK